MHRASMADGAAGVAHILIHYSELFRSDLGLMTVPIDYPSLRYFLSRPELRSMYSRNNSNLG